MAIRLFSTLCILILIAKPSGTPIQEDLDEAVNSIRRAMAERTQDDAKPEDSWEPEMPMTWLVRDTRAFGVDGKTSPADHPVDLRLTYQEWLAIYFDALGLDKSAFEETAARLAAQGQGQSFLTEFDDEIPGFPLLSRIRGPYHDVVFERDELEDLRKECLKVQASTSNTLALQGLEKLIHIYDQARRLGLSIYFISN
jgi:hypothetical protein